MASLPSEPHRGHGRGGRIGRRAQRACRLKPGELEALLSTLRDMAAHVWCEIGGGPGSAEQHRVWATRELTVGSAVRADAATIDRDDRNKRLKASYKQPQTR
jgi:hypothetical protein